MKVIHNRILPIGKNFTAINLFGVLFAKRGVEITPSLLNHESIHTAQIRELFWIPFYIIYVIEWLIRIIQYRGKIYPAYYNISFEKEAYRHDSEPGYLKSRRHFAQWRK